MYLWSTKGLIKELRDGSLDQKEKVKYFVVFLLMYNVGFELSLFAQENYSIDDLTSFVVNTVIMVVAIYLCFRINRDGDDVEFIDRFVCLGLPITIRFICSLFAILIGLSLLSIFFGDSFNPWAEEDSLLVVVEGVAVEILFYWRIGVAIKLTSHPQNDRIA